jgi:hypothetical protein
MEKEGLPLAAAHMCHVQPYSGSFAHLTLIPKIKLYYGIPDPGLNGDHQKSTSKAR